MTFEEWYANHPLWDIRLPVVETWLRQCWKDATTEERQRCVQEASKERLLNLDLYDKLRREGFYYRAQFRLERVESAWNIQKRIARPND